MLNLPRVSYESLIFAGGLDQVSPTLSLKPGVCKAALNFECSPTTGYTRIAGYERYDGRPAPSDAAFTILAVTGSTGPASGVTITGDSSGATGVLVASTATSFVVTKVTGTFDGTEILKVSGTPVGTQAGFGATLTTKLYAQYKAAAASAYRTDIAAPTGSGAILGAFAFGGSVYAFRNNAGATAAGLWKATSSGWTAVTFGEEVSFTAASTQPSEGAVVTQGGVTATVRRVVLQSGAFAGGTAAGRLIVTGRSGGSFAAGAFTAGFTATCSGAQTAVDFLPGGKFQFYIANFAGSAQTARVYGCDGVNRAFEFDGTTLVPITTGTTTDTPKFIAAHKNQLFLAFGASAIHSAPGLPYDYTALSGASEIATGDTITGFLVQPGSQATAAIAIYQRSNTLMLYGTGTTTWNLVAFNTGTGAIPYSCQNMSQSFVLDDRGIMKMDTTLAYGNFDQTALTAAIRPFIVAERSLTAASVLCREKSQYRLFFSDGMGLHATIVNGKYQGAMPIYYPITGGISNAWAGTLTNGDEILLGCGADGMLYRLDRGTSFDGAPVFASITTNFDSVRSPRMLKRWRKAAIEMLGTSYAEVEFSYVLGYGDGAEYSQPGPTAYAAAMLRNTWDSTAVWDTFFWDASGLTPAECEMGDTSENVALTFSSFADYAEPFTLNSAIIHFTPRRGLR